MQSDLEELVRLLFELLREMREQLGAFGVVALGMVLFAGIMLCFFAVIWIRRGGLRAGAARRFFAERREVDHWLRRH